MTKFNIPQTLDDAYTRRDRLQSEVEDIQTQLTSRDRRGPDGNRLSRQDYLIWKQRAKFALNLRLDEIRFLKGWIRRFVEKINAVGIPIAVFLRITGFAEAYSKF